MTGVTEQNDAAFAPFRQRLALQYRPFVTIRTRIEHRTHLWMKALVSSAQLTNVAFRGPRLARHPLGGLGLNCGIHDAVDLAAKVGRVWRGEGREELLDLWDRQRRLTNLEYIQKVSVENKARQEEADLGKRAIGMDFMHMLQSHAAMRMGFLTRWVMIDSLVYARAIQ